MGDDGLLELRIHGVNNTPPVSLLYAIEEEYGNALTGVYRQRTHAIPVKAYSWGGLARMSPIPRIPLANWAGSVASAAWIAVVPFGLANVAYWSRRLTLPGENLEGVRNTAALSRIFSLGLTLLFVASVCSVSLDMTETRVRSDADLPAWLSWLRTVEPGVRMAIFSLLPVIAVLFLKGLAKVTRTLYDKGSKLQAPPATTTTAAGSIASQETWKFGSRSFWDNADLSKHNAEVHTAAGVALTLIWTGQFWFPAHRQFGVGVIALAVAVIVGCVLLIRRMPLSTEGGAIGNVRKRLADLLSWVSYGIFVVQFGALVVAGSRETSAQHLVGLSLIPGALVFGLFVLAVSALGWRVREKNSYLAATVLFVVGIAAVAVHEWWKSKGASLTLIDGLLVGVVLVIVGGWLWLVYRRGSGSEAQHSEEAWRGTAPGVLMVLSLFAAVLLSTVFVMVSAALMGDGSPRMSATELMTVSPIYLSFAAMITVVLGVLLLALGYVGWRVIAHCAQPIEPDLDETTGPSSAEISLLATAFADANPTPGWANLLRLGGLWTLAGRRCLIRRRASLAHRAEPIVAVLAVVTASGMCGGLILALTLHDRVIADNSALISIRQFGVTAAVFLGLAIAGAGASRSRPLGIVWDLICFLPRAAHPFGPPCYAQRAVPELHAYCSAWLDKPTATQADDATVRKMILSAHSLGGVLAVATVLLLADKYPGRIALITYGCQLRTYFGRIFPELLGPRVLGVTKSVPAQLTGCPTFPPPPVPALAPVDGSPPSVRQILTPDAKPMWINLWRPTDYLGFPVYSREANNPIDRPADEVTAEVAADGFIVQPEGSSTVHFEPKTTVRVDTHSDYFRAPQYDEAIEVLAARLGLT